MVYKPKRLLFMYALRRRTFLRLAQELLVTSKYSESVPTTGTTTNTNQHELQKRASASIFFNTHAQILQALGACRLGL